MTNIQATSITQIAYILSIKGHFPNRIASAHSSFFLPIASPSIILVDSLIFGYLFTNLSSTRSLCQRAVIYLTMLLYEKKHKFYWRFHQYLCTFLCILYNFSYIVMKFSKSFHFHFNMIFFCQSILFSNCFISYFEIFHSYIAFLWIIYIFHFFFYAIFPCTFPPCSSLQIMLQFLNKW